MKTFQCKACRRILPVTSKNPEQQYCSRIDCQRARKRAWQRKKRDTDPDYRQNQIDAQKRWLDRHPDYWRGYRKRSQRSPPPPESPAAKMDGFPQKTSFFQGNTSSPLSKIRMSRWMRFAPSLSLFQPVPTR